MHVVGVREQLARHVPGGGASLGQQADYLRLPFADGAQVAIEKFFVVMNGFAVAAVHQGRRKRAQPRQTNEVFGERVETLRAINWVWRKNWNWSDPFEHTIARDHRAIRLANKRAGTWSMSGRMDHAQRARLKLEFRLIFE